MLSNYETSDGYSATQIDEIAKWCDENIGTEYEVNSVDDLNHQLVIFEVTQSDIKKLMKLEDIYNAK